MLYLPSQDEVGQGVVEYGLMTMIVVIIAVIILSLLGPAIGNIFSNIYACV